MRAFLLHLVNEAKVSYGMLVHYVSALRFLYKITLQRPWNLQTIPYPRPEKHLPEIPAPPRPVPPPIIEPEVDGTHLNVLSQLETSMRPKCAEVTNNLSAKPHNQGV